MSRTSRAGFTLMEMLVTLSLAALVGGIAAPRVERALQTLELRGTARRLALDLAALRAAALRQGMAMTLTVAADGSGYRGPGGAVGLPAGLHLSGSGTIAFQPDGVATPGRLLLGSTGRGAGPIAVAVTGNGQIALVRPLPAEKQLPEPGR